LLFQSPPKRRLIVRESVAGFAINFDRDALLGGNPARYFILESEIESVGGRLADDLFTMETTKIYKGGGLHCLFKSKKAAKLSGTDQTKYCGERKSNPFEGALVLIRLCFF
jgi:hypothetical protein